jgi:hypothetical protein
VGGIHGGYEWNTSMLAYDLIDYLGENQKLIPKNLKVAVIPALNPDGLFEITGKEGYFSIADVKEAANGAGRLNADNVDLNRNFDCKWKAQAVWKNKTVSAGTGAFSEPESQAIRDYVLQNKPAAAVFWHSQSNTIYGSACGEPMLSETQKIMDAYSTASGYKTAPTFDGYEVTGDATDWLASIGIPAFSVELSTHETAEWQRNWAGVKSLFEYYTDK